MWAAKLMETKPFKLVAVAIANKLARIAFAVMRSGSIYGSAMAGWPSVPMSIVGDQQIEGDYVVMRTHEDRFVKPGA